MDPHPAAYLDCKLEPNWYFMVDKAVAFHGIIQHSIEDTNTNYTSNVTGPQLFKKHILSYYWGEIVIYIQIKFFHLDLLLNLVKQKMQTILRSDY